MMDTSNLGWGQFHPRSALVSQLKSLHDATTVDKSRDLTNRTSTVRQA